MNAYLIPFNLELPALTAELASRNRKYGFVHKMLFVITTITKTQLRLKLDAKEYVQLHAKTLMHFVGENKFRLVMDYLKEFGIVEVNESYRFGRDVVGVCKSYRLAQKYRTRYITQPTDAFRNKGYYSFPGTPTKNEVQKENLTECHLYLKKNLERVELEGVEPFGEHLDTQKYNYWSFAVRSIREKDFYFCVGEASGRVTNNVTNFPKELRKHLRLDGKPLVNVDICNCHPLLLARFYRQHSEEQIRYVGIVEGGTFYRVLTDHLNEKFSALPEAERKEKIAQLEFLKKAFAQFVNASLKDLARYKNTIIKDIERAFGEMFPILSQEIRKLKDRTSLAMELQRLESKLIIGSVVEALMRDGKTVLTIHDSILCFAEDVGFVSSTIKSHCQTLYGVTPSLKNSLPAPTIEEEDNLDDLLELIHPMSTEEQKYLEFLIDGLENGTPTVK